MDHLDLEVFLAIVGSGTVSVGQIMQERGMGQIKDYDDPSLHRTIYGICHKQNQKNPLIREFLGLVIDAQEA